MSLQDRHSLRAEPHTGAPLLRTAAAGLACLLALAGCAREGALAKQLAEEDENPVTVEELEAVDPVQGGEPVPEHARELVEEFIELLTPLDPTLTSDHHDAQIKEMFELRDRLLAERDHDVGRAALQAYARNYNNPLSRVRAGLLKVGGVCAPDDAHDLLLTLATQYGHPIDDRTEAALVLAEVAPESYFTAMEAWVTRRGRAEMTMPNDEFLVRGWVIACAKTGRSPVPVLADVVTNLLMEDAARHQAARELGNHPDDPLGRKALETALVESSGNGYLRRMAAQSLRQILPNETACVLFSHVLANEADLNFGRFLEDLIQENCR